MIPLSSSDTFSTGLASGRTVWRMLFAVGAMAGAVAGAEEARTSKIERLGFKFSQAEHDAAVAREAAGVVEPQPELADLDIVRLPKHYVTEKAIPLEERELLTPKGRVAVAMKRYINPAYAKTLGPLAAVASFLNNPLGGWAPNTPEAMSLYHDDEQKARNGRMRELTGMLELSRTLKSSTKKEQPAVTKRAAK